MKKIDSGLHYPLDMNTLSKTWSVSYIGDVAIEIQPGFASGEHNQEGTGIPHVRPMNINRQGNLDLSVVKYVSPDKDKKRLRAGDVLFNNTNSPELIGKTTVINKDIDWAFSNHMTRIVFPQEVSPKFVAYQLHFLWSMGYFLHKCVKHVNQASISSKTLGDSVPLILAPFNEQKLIVSEIEKQFSRLDEAVAALKRVRASLKRYKASVLKAAVEGKLTEEWRKRSGEVAAPFFETNKLRKGGETPPLQKQGADLPEGWRCAKLVEVAEINPKLSKNISDNVEVSFLPMKAVQEETGMIDLSITKKFEEVKRGYTSFINNDIIFAKITPCMENGKIAIVENLRNSLGFGSTEFHVIRLHEPKSIKYLFYFLLQRDIRKQAQRSMTGTAGQLRVPAKFMQEIAVSLPPIPEQQKIVEEIESRLSVAEEIKATIDINLKRAERLRQAILKQAFSGRLV